MNIHEAKTHLSKLIERVAAGEEIVISKAGKPVAKLVPYSAQVTPRTGGFLAGQIWESADCWEPDSELTDSMTKSPLFPEERYSSKVAEKPSPRRRK
ncbi:type II toxin-antitoxin system Phd/YefM family antitoxin [Luteolibacter soli]|uniref:Antitoxin n=1 Tax=Luteolibacter soli TaxID=3135280 RepID=A0ABU9AQA1_9BACT